MSAAAAASGDRLFDARIESRRLYYEKRWYSRGQPVFIESKSFPAADSSRRLQAEVCGIANDDLIAVQIVDSRSNFCDKVYHLTTRDLRLGIYAIKKRAT
jgi:hypothetical protein